MGVEEKPVSVNGVTVQHGEGLERRKVSLKVVSQSRSRQNQEEKRQNDKH